MSCVPAIYPDLGTEVGRAAGRVSEEIRVLAGSFKILERRGRGGWVLLIKHFVCRGDSAGLGTDGSRRVSLIDKAFRVSRRFSRTWNGWVAGGGAPALNDDDDENENENEKHGIPDNPPQQRTQGKNTPFGKPLTPILEIYRKLSACTIPPAPPPPQRTNFRSPCRYSATRGLRKKRIFDTNR